ncbi:LytTR family DNA-binding domain-containing protein [Paraclostridium ghonii]|uniref:DNA-binding LytR/AlgR family response regulator n=1 Tax=Paraclostridium ghonii TaxID=29358 RepID=A0ABU0N2I8_9FIRM|nr:LytTR family DNA-binding domain-containing protein [Paeniclostridium ghonii]MCM0167486.1 LytTR family transcriptional regulator [Paeniclostridium ghonii]MDQ0557351.1 DNA-binding LytR/AlgR family response regulator [Paeniclostridium ghonii]
MKIEIEIDENIKEDKFIIKCKELTDDINKIQKAIKEILEKKIQITFYKDNVEYYISLGEVLFFETENSNINAHTKENVYQVKYKLYELEEILPNNFMRVSKSTILNVDLIYSVTKNITSSSIVEFQNTHKTVYVSRYYYKPLKLKLLEKRR